jgi:uncharacterized protein YcfJ
VEWIREMVEQGNPAGGAALGAVIGGLFGHALTGRSSGTLAGAVGGAAVGASASQGSTVDQVAVRFDDGEERVFAFRGYSPFRVGDAVTWTAAGLHRRRPPVDLAPYPPDLPPPPPQ